MERNHFENLGYRMRVIGYHGTSGEGAERILAHGFQLSRNDYDWLGDGAYFFQDSPARALEWARERFRESAAVLGAEIDLDGCLDLLDPEWNTVIQEAYTDLVSRIGRMGQRLPRQSPGAHRIDRAVVNHAVGLLQLRGVEVRSVRAAFIEGEPLFPGSALWSRAHVQVAVRDPGAIVALWRMQPPEEAA
ncbi:MAG TPA: hypothetical protein VFJ82_27135 [Longimicrobium sp.]|nr:hypothetical protein [Longimicrobium sp.]